MSKTVKTRRHRVKSAMLKAERTNREAQIRLSATVDPQVLATAKLFAEATGFKHSFSAYLNALIERDNKHRADLLNEKASPSQAQR